jgi:TPR repeat protein
MEQDPRLTNALDLARRGQRNAAARIFRRLAKAGNAEAAVELGDLIDWGLDPEDPRETAVAWYKIAAEGGSALGALRYGRKLSDDSDTISGEAAEWCRRGLAGLTEQANAGDTESQFNLWFVWDDEQGSAEDNARVLAHLRAAAKSGHLEACFHLGNWYWERPNRTERQRRRAISLWRRAANGGLESAQYTLGVDYATDPNMPINPKESVRFYRMSALNGNAEALHNLGMMSLLGEGIPKDEAAGIAMIIKAAERGIDVAMLCLIHAYTLGEDGLPVDKEEAAYWQSRYDKLHVSE